MLKRKKKLLPRLFHGVTASFASLAVVGGGMLLPSSMARAQVENPFAVSTSTHEPPFPAKDQNPLVKQLVASFESHLEMLNANNQTIETILANSRIEEMPAVEELQAYLQSKKAQAETAQAEAEAHPDKAPSAKAAAETVAAARKWVAAVEEAQEAVRVVLNDVSGRVKDFLEAQLLDVSLIRKKLREIEASTPVDASEDDVKAKFAELAKSVEKGRGLTPEKVEKLKEKLLSDKEILRTAQDKAEKAEVWFKQIVFKNEEAFSSQGSAEEATLRKARTEQVENERAQKKPAKPEEVHKETPGSGVAEKAKGVMVTKIAEALPVENPRSVDQHPSLATSGTDVLWPSMVGGGVLFAGVLSLVLRRFKLRRGTRQFV